MLVDAGRYPRGYALTILAIDEFGKHLSCVGAATVRADQAGYWERYRSNYTSHHAKYGIALATLTGAVAERDPGVAPFRGGIPYEEMPCQRHAGSTTPRARAVVPAALRHQGTGPPGSRLLSRANGN
jgi:hypothetical protein